MGGADIFLEINEAEGSAAHGCCAEFSCLPCVVSYRRIHNLSPGAVSALRLLWAREIPYVFSLLYADEYASDTQGGSFSLPRLLPGA